MISDDQGFYHHCPNCGSYLKVEVEYGKGDAVEVCGCCGRKYHIREIGVEK